MQATPQNFTTPSLFLAFELGGSNWKLGFAVSPGRVRERNVLARNVSAVLAEIRAAKKRFRLPEDAPVTSCYEAGRDGFWLHRWLEAEGLRNHVVEPASILVDRRARRTKTDRLDVKRLLAQLIRYSEGEQDVLRVVRVPDPEDEDLRRITRERRRVVKEITQHSNRITSLLNLQGIKLPSPRRRDYPRTLDSFVRDHPHALGCRILAEIRRQLARLRLAEDQLGEINTSIKRLLKQPPSCRIVEAAQQLFQLKGVGEVGASTLAFEFLGWREFSNRRQVGALAGLTDSHWKSDGIDRQQGISKAGSPRVRALMIELAWGWLRWQPDSQLSHWFHEATGGTKRKRLRRVAIVALARKLLVALWHWVEHGVVPDGATLKDGGERAWTASAASLASG